MLGYKGLRLGGGNRYLPIRSTSTTSVDYVEPPRALNTDVPLANAGEIIPYVIGRRRVSTPNVLSYGSPRALTETIVTTETRTYEQKVEDPPGFGRFRYEQVTETITTETTIAVGFLTDIVIGICLGPDAVLRGIYVDNEPIWEGTAGPARTELVLPENETAFSKCEVAFNGGAFDQIVDPWTTAPVDQPSDPGEMTAGEVTFAVLGAITRYVGVGAEDIIHGQYPAFGDITEWTSSWQVRGLVNTYVRLLDGPESFIGAVLQLHGDRTYLQSVDVSINGGPVIEFMADTFRPELNATRFVSATPLPILDEGVYSVDISPSGPGIPSNMPGYVGIAYMILKDVRTDLRIGALSFEIERFPNPLGLTVNQNRRGNDINVATAMYELLNSDWGGAGIAAQYIGSSFNSAALTFSSDGDFCSVIIDTETSAAAVLGELQKQSYSLVYPDPSTAKIEVKPIRQSGLNLGSALNLDRGNVINLNEFKKNSWASTLEILQAVFPNRVNNYEPTPLVAQSIQNSETRGSRRSSSTSLPFAPTVDLAATAVARMLSQALVPIFTCTVQADRTAAEAKPGDVALLNWPQYGIYSEPVVVTRVRKHPLRDNTVSLTVGQYRTPSSEGILVIRPDDTTPTILGTNPVAPADAFILTAPFFFARKAGVIDLSTDTNKSFPMFLAIPANSLQLGTDVTVENAGASPVVASIVAVNVTYPTYGQLHAAIDKYDGWTDGLLGNVRLNGVVNMVNISSMVSVPREGRFLLLVGEEIFAFDSVTDLGSEAIQLNNVRRSVVDTVARNHSVGDNAFIISNVYSNIPSAGFDTPLSYTPTWRFISQTINEKGRPQNLATTLVKSGWVPRVRRSIAAPRPHDTKVDGVRRSTPIFLAINESYTVSWRSRSREATLLRFQTDPADPNEIYAESTFQSHRVYLRSSANVTYNLGETASDAANINQLLVAIPDDVAEGPGVLFVRAVTNHGESVYDDEIPVMIFRGQTFNFSYELEE